MITRKFSSLILLGGTTILAAGCMGQTAGAMLYWTGLFKTEKIEAKFEFGDGPVLILVDDPDATVHWPQTLVELADATRNQLLANNAARKVLPADTVSRLRTQHPDFDDRGCREIGQMAGAHQVLWLEVREFAANENTDEGPMAAKMSVAVRVVNAMEESERSKVRQWPTYPEGERLSAELGSVDLAKARSGVGVSRALAEKLGDQIAKLFYDHRASEFDSGKS